MNAATRPSQGIQRGGNLWINIYYRNRDGSDNWGKVTKITPLDGSYQDYFGCCVSISGDTLVVGSYADNAPGADSGSAYIFERHHNGTDSWGEVKKITPADSASLDNFGTSVSVSGDWVVVGSRWDDNTAANTGSVCVFERDEGSAGNWGQVTKFTPMMPLLMTILAHLSPSAEKT